MSKILIKNIQVTDHRGSYISDVLIEGNLIAKIDKNIDEENAQIINGENKVLMPSFVDLHAHFRDPGYTYKEDIESGSKAALKGGYTVVYTMGNTNPICDNMEVYKSIIQKSKDLDLIDLYQIISVTKSLEGKELTDFSTFDENIKFVSDDGKGILSNHMMYQACLEAKKNNIGIMVHAEDPEISPYDYRVAEDIITKRDIYLSEITGCKIHFSHVSTKGSIEAIREAKNKGLNVTCETTPHHIYLSNNDYRVNPPIRTKEDNLAIIEGIKDGTVDAISTDHAPHSKEDKEKRAPGMIGLETSFSVSFTSLVETGEITIEKLSEIMSYNPAKILGLDHGEIEINKKANLVILDLNEEYEFTEEDIISKSKNTPFIGEKLKGKVLITIRNGKILYGENLWL